MISEEELDAYRLNGTQVRVVRDALEMNDVVGTVVAWDAESVVIRKANRRVVKLSRSYRYEPASQPRTNAAD
ncbi:hypothetical protein [Paenibacillus humicola]|uniref:hypothetical protein n=1 Tax=Paenibacillus humicola TaxID=3110540 RepID=UPI00237B1A25|nr:hypothetical protein [Paenibacillus humicola]